MDSRSFDAEIDLILDPFRDMFKYSSKVDEIKDALHITKAEHFSTLNSTVANNIQDRENNAASVYTDILAYNQIPVLISVGMYDMKDGVRQTLEWIKGVDFEDREKFDTQPRKNFTYYDQTDGTTVKTGGWYRHHDLFSVIITPQAGHMVPVTQPYMSKMQVKSMMEHGHLACETESDYGCHSFASSMLVSMTDCNGHGTGSVSTGKCTCDDGWYGADCSTTVTDLATSGSVSESVTASRWFYYSVPATEAFDLQLVSDRSVSVYIRQGLDEIPDTQTFDSVIKN